MSKFNLMFYDYFTFSSSAMSSVVETGILYGRPYGGTTIMITDKLRSHVQTVHAAERYVVIKICNYIFVNLYLPCTGTPDRHLIVEEVLGEVDACLRQFNGCIFVVGGDLNCDLDFNSTDTVSMMIFELINNFNLHRCDTTLGSTKDFTYSNDALGKYSCIDFVLMSDVNGLLSYSVIDRGSNLSDHHPVFVEFTANLGQCLNAADSKIFKISKSQKYLRWDKANLDTFYSMTGDITQPLLTYFNGLVSGFTGARDDAILIINDVYNELVQVLHTSANSSVPMKRQNFYKFWWCQELDLLKENSIRDHSIWKNAGKPRSGPIFDAYRKSKLNYKKEIRQRERQESLEYTNELHEALLNKQGPAFWKVWRSKFETNKGWSRPIDGASTTEETLRRFVEYFKQTGCSLTVAGNEVLRDKYANRRENYIGTCHNVDFEFSVHLVENTIINMKRGKAPGLDGLTAEHLQHCHPSVCVLLTKLFNYMMAYGCVPNDFGLMYTVPLLKNSYSNFNKSISVDDFRGISISQVISKIFERCILNRYGQFLATSDNQFGFKAGLGCPHAIYTVKSVVNAYTCSGSTVNLCALDVKKAFDKLNHYGLFLKLMDRMVPGGLLLVLEYWLDICTTCVRWDDSISEFFSVDCGVRQGGVLSPYLFAIYIDDIVNKINSSDLGCRLGLRK